MIVILTLILQPHGLKSMPNKLTEGLKKKVKKKVETVDETAARLRKEGLDAKSVELAEETTDMKKKHESIQEALRKAGLGDPKRNRRKNMRK